MNETIEQRLRDLEVKYVEGQRALDERNQLVLEMVEGGYKQADIFRRLNEARSTIGAKSLTRDAVFALVRRGKSLKSNL